jgi:ubiquinone/menaquinone biosynthesis C-methylase UbiE
MVYAERDRAHKSNKGNPGRERTLRERGDTMERMLGDRLERPLSEFRVLDIGCGKGSLLGWFHEKGVPAENLFGIDLSSDRIRIARKTYPAFTFVEGDAEELGFPDNSFDLVLLFTVFSSILDEAMATNVAREIGRVLKQGGAVVWHDLRYPNPWNPTLRAMTKRRIRELFPSFELKLELIYLLPPIARRLGRFTDWTYPMLASIPVLRSHYFGLLCPSQGPVCREIELSEEGQERGSQMRDTGAASALVARKPEPFRKKASSGHDPGFPGLTIRDFVHVTGASRTAGKK